MIRLLSVGMVYPTNTDSNTLVHCTFHVFKGKIIQYPVNLSKKDEMAIKKFTRAALKKEAAIRMGVIRMKTFNITSHDGEVEFEASATLDRRLHHMR